MLNYFKLLIIAILLHVSVHAAQAENGFDNFENKAFDFVPNDPQKELSSSFRQSSSQKITKDIITKSLFVTYLHVPKKGYVNQPVKLSVKVVITRDFDEIVVNDLPKNIGKIISYDNTWQEISQNTYVKDIYFQSFSTAQSLPQIQMSIKQNNQIIESAKLPKEDIDIIKLNDDGKFIQLFANSLHVKQTKSTLFDENSIIMVLQLQGNEANFQDIHFENVLKQGKDTISGKYPNQTIYYYIVLPKTRQHVEFSYFNTQENNFKTIKLTVKLDQDDLSTQIDINPKKSDYELYKEIIIGSISLLFLILFFIKRKIAFALISLIIGAYLLYSKVSIKNIVLKKDTKVRILPTEKSTIFHTTQDTQNAEQLNIVNSYIKVLLEDGTIGWVKKDDIF